MKKNLIVLQEGVKECGSAVMLSIIRYYGGNISINRLVELTRTTKEGTNFYNMSKAFNEIGLDSKGYKIDDKKKLIEVDVPFICQLVNNNYCHFVVVYRIKNDSFILMDPSKGKVVMKKNDFFKLWTGYILIVKPNKQIPYFKEEKHLNQTIINVLLNNKVLISNITLISIIFTLLTCLYSFYFQIIIDKVLNTSMNNLIIVSIIFSIIIIIKSILNYSRNELLIYLNQKIDLSIFIYSFKKIILLPYNYYKNKTTGEVISRINDLSYIKNLLSKIIITVFLDFLICIVGAFILYGINDKMFFISLLIIMIYIVILYTFRPFIKRMTNDTQENSANVNSYLVETISGFETIKGLNIESNVISKMKNKYIKALNSVLYFDKLSNLELFLKDLFSNLGIVLIYYFGIKEVMNNNLSIGNVITFNSLLIYFLDPIRNIIDLNKDYHYVVNSLKRVNNLLEIDSEKLKLDYKPLKGNIEFKNVVFSYNNRDNVLKSVSLDIKDGEKVLVLGNSGSGKSTILKLLYRYYEPKRNSIFINGNEILDFDISIIRNNICYISQNEMLFTDTIKNNIILNRNIDDEYLFKISKMTYVDDIIKNKFLGYDTMLEENGVNISGGQRQRIILARALMKKSNILLIDEGLNEIDINLERKILKNIFKYFKEKTIIIVSHRVDNLDLYDKVIKLNNGEIIEIIKRNRGEYIE